MSESEKLLEKEIDRAAIRLANSSTRELRLFWWDRLKDLHGKRSEKYIEEMESKWAK